MAVVVSAIIGLFFALASLAFTRMGAYFLFPASGLFEPHAGIHAVLPIASEVGQTGLAMIAGGWFVSTFVGTYLSNFIARNFAAGRVVTAGMLGAALLLAAMRGEPLWLVVASLLLVFVAGRVAERRMRGRPRPDRRKQDIPVAVERRRPRAAPLGGVPGAGEPQPDRRQRSVPVEVERRGAPLPPAEIPEAPVDRRQSAIPVEIDRRDPQADRRRQAIPVPVERRRAQPLSGFPGGPSPSLDESNGDVAPRRPDVPPR